MARATFRPRDRITLANDYRAAFGARLKKARHPLVVFGRPNGLGHARLGLSVGRRVGNAVARNRVKRLLRESFRLSRDDLPQGFDLVVNVRPHQPLPLREYQRLLVDLATEIERAHTRRESRS